MALPAGYKLDLKQRNPGDGVEMASMNLPAGYMLDGSADPAAPPQDDNSWVGQRAAMRKRNLELTAALPPPPEPSSPGRLSFDRDLMIGAGKGIIDSATSLARLPAWTGNWVGQIPAVKEFVNDPDLAAGLHGQNFPQKAGKFAEQTGEFMLGDAVVTKGIEALPALAKLPKLVKGALAGAGGGAGVTAAHDKDAGEVATSAAIGGAAPLIVRGAGLVLGKLGKRIEQTLIKASKADIEDGFDVNTIFKNNLGGSLKATAAKVDKRIEQLLSRQRAALGANPSTPTGTINTMDALTQAEADLAAEIQAGRHVTFSDRIPAIIEKYRERLKMAGQAGVVDVPTANRLKTGVGDAGAWQYGRPDPESAAEETVANKLYSKLRTEIELNSAPNLHSINQQIQELIPVRRALIRRLPVEARNRIISLPEVVELAHGRIGLFLIDRALKSGNVANALVKGGGVLGRGVGAAFGAAGRTAAGNPNDYFQSGGRNTQSMSAPPRPNE